jgi:hypothetical protein
VICIQEKKEVLDEAILTFTDTFYTAVFEGNSICSAFTIAQKLTINKHNNQQASIFKLLKDETHQCAAIEFSQNEPFKNISDKILVKEIPAKAENILFREKEQAKLV